MTRIAYVQFAPHYLAVEDNLATVERMLGQHEADLFVLPELFTSGYFFHSTDDVRSVAEEVPSGPTCARLRGWAEEHEATIVAGLAEREGEQLYNSAVVVQPSGQLDTYRKTHLYYEEKLHFMPGDTGLLVVEIGGRVNETYRLGVMICFDWYYPEAARSLALQGADVIAHPSNLVRPDCPRAMPIRALENHVYTITANRYGVETHGEETLTFIGQSLICDPAGEVLASAPREGDHVTAVEVDLRTSRNRTITAHNHLFQDRRPELYRL